MNKLKLAIEPRGHDPKRNEAILKTTKSKMTEREGVSDFKEALTMFIHHCEATCNLVDVIEDDTDAVISLIVQTKDEAQKFADKLERLIHARLHQRIFVSVVET